jgi:hypothetical protein
VSDDQLKETTSAEYRAVASQSPYAALAEELYRERVIRARQMPAEEKILAGQRLFEAACEITLAGIRNQFPGQSEDHYREILRERLVWRRKRQAAT